MLLFKICTVSKVNEEFTILLTSKVLQAQLEHQTFSKAFSSYLIMRLIFYPLVFNVS